MTPLQEQTLRKQLLTMRRTERQLHTKFRNGEVSRQTLDALSQRNDDTVIAMVRGMTTKRR